MKIIFEFDEKKYTKKDLENIIDEPTFYRQKIYRLCDEITFEE